MQAYEYQTFYLLFTPLSDALKSNDTLKSRDN